MGRPRAAHPKPRVGADPVGPQHLVVEAASVGEIVEHQPPGRLPQQLLADLDVPHDVPMQRHRFTYRCRRAHEPLTRFVGTDPGAPGELGDGRREVDPVRGDDQIDRRSSVPARPAPPPLLAPPGGRHRHRRMQVLVLGVRATPPGTSPGSRSRTGELIEQGTKVGAGEHTVAVKPRHYASSDRYPRTTPAAR